MPKKILVIDDDPVGVRLMQGRLASEGFLVEAAINGEIGLRKAGEFHPDMIILDVEMPEMNGYTFMIEMKKSDAIKDIPVIVLTAHEENRAIFIRRGIKHYMVKPVDFNLLKSRMQEIWTEAKG